MCAHRPYCSSSGGLWPVRCLHGRLTGPEEEEGVSLFPPTSLPPLPSHARPRPCGDPGTHRARGELRRVVIHICHGDDGCGRVREAIVQVPLHVGGLDDDCVLLNFLEGTGWGRTGHQCGVRSQAVDIFHQRSISSPWLGPLSPVPQEAAGRWALRVKPGGRTSSVGNGAALGAGCLSASEALAAVSTD